MACPLSPVQVVAEDRFGICRGSASGVLAQQPLEPGIAADRIPELVETRRLHADEIGRLRQQPRDLVKCSIGQHLGWPFRSHGRDLGHTKQTRPNDGLTSAHYAAADRCASRAGWWLEPRLRVGGTLSEAVYAAVGRTTHLAASRRLARSRSDIQPRHASPTGG